MKLFSVLLSVTLLPALAFAQEEGAWPEPSPESKAYHDYRMKLTTPPYGLEKVKTMISKASSVGEGEGEGEAIRPKDYLTLSLREKFTYHMIYTEAYSQNCDATPPIIDEHKKIFAQLPDIFGEGNWSSRQRDFLVGNKDSVLAIIEESANRSKRLGANYKMAIVEVNGLEMIPFLIEFYKRDYKDHDILTTLLLLMNGVKYPPFVQSTSYTKLYGPNSTYDAWLQYNKANEELIFQRAMALYNSMN